MLPIALVLFVAASAIAAPTVEFSILDVNSVGPQQSKNGEVGSWLFSNAFENPDNGELGAYNLMARENIGDLADTKEGRVYAISQALASLTKVTAGSPGDACVSSNLIEAVVSGNPSAIRRATSEYVQVLAQEIAEIAQLATNPESRRFESGKRGNCKGGGSVYNFEAAWDIVRSDAPPGTSGLLQEQYCNAKRLYNGFFQLSRNIGAAITAASQAPIINIIRQPQVTNAATNFLNAVGSGSPQAGQAGRALSQALLGASY